MRLSFLVILVLCGVLGGCARQTPTPPKGLKQIALGFPSDDWNREIKLSAPAKRVVCIGPGATETIFALGAGDKLVGRDQISDYPKETAKIPIVGDYTGPFIEKVIAAKPDLVIVQGETYDAARADNWQKKIGVPVAILVPTSVDKVADGVKKIGKWLNAPEGTERISQSLQKTYGTQEVFSFVEIQRSPLWTAGSKTLINDVIFRAGFYNIAERGTGSRKVAGYKQYSLETLTSLRPVYLQAYIVPMRNPDKVQALRELRTHPGLSRLDCIRRERVVVIKDDLVLRPGPRLAQGISQLNKQAKLIADDFKKNG